MTSLPGLAGEAASSLIIACRGMLQTTTDATDDDRHQRAKQYWPSNTMCRRASNKQCSVTHKIFP